MKVHIEKDIYLSGDGRSFQLERRSVVKGGEKKGDELYIPFAYHSSIGGAINSLIKMKVSESTATTLLELIEDIKRIESEIKAIVLI